jgi:hypothetical protein
VPPSFNLSVGESLELDAAAWISGDDALASIAALGAGGWGDVYARTPVLGDVPGEVANGVR